MSDKSTGYEVLTCKHRFVFVGFDEWMRIVYDELWAIHECQLCGFKKPLTYLNI